MMHARLLKVTLIVLLTASPCWAGTPCGLSSQQPGGYIYLSSDSTGYDGSYRILDRPGLQKIYVLASANGITACEFSAPLPECLIGVTYISDTNPWLLRLGDSQNGVSISFGSCVSGDAIYLMTINVMMQGLTRNCCIYPVKGHPIPGLTGYSGPLFAGCSTGWLFPIGFGANVVDEPGTKLDTPVPPDGASDQPLDARLSWAMHPCNLNGCGMFFVDVYFGTDADPPFLAHLQIESYPYYYNPGPLQPNTTYHWRLTSSGTDVPWDSPVWSFTTGDGTPAQSTSWGVIKALYRE